MDFERFVNPLFWSSDALVEKPTSPKQFDIRQISVDDAVRINQSYHSRLPNIHPSNIIRNKHSACYGAVFNGIYYAVAIWSSPVAANRLKDGDKLLELRRMAISDDAPRNTASYMIAKMVSDITTTMPDIIRCISYQDTEVHHGTIYKASNWTATNISNGQSWTNEKRKRNKEQTMAPKVRWEFNLKRSKHTQQEEPSFEGDYSKQEIDAMYGDLRNKCQHGNKGVCNSCDVASDLIFKAT